MENKTQSDSVICPPGHVSLKQTMKSLIWLAATCALYVGMSWLVRQHPDWSPEWRVAAALTPLLPGVFYLLSLLRSFREMDELQRRIQLEAWIFALAATVVVDAVLNVLNANGIGPQAYRHGLQIGGVYIMMYLFWCVGITFSRLRYR